MNKLSKYQLEIVDLFWIFLVSIFIRFNSLGPNSLWQDDSYVALVIKVTNIEEFKLVAGHHPGYSLLLLNLYNFFGFSELVFQIPSIIFGIVTPVIGTLALRRNNFGRRFSFIFGLFLASAPTLVLVSSRIKPYSMEAFITVMYLYFLSTDKNIKNNLFIFVFSLASLFASFYSIFVIAAYYLSITNFRVYKIKENLNLYLGLGVLVFFFLSYPFYLSSLPLISSIMIHPHVFYDWPFLDILKGVSSGFNSMAMATVIPIYLLKWTSYNLFSETSLIYPVFYSSVSMIVLINSRKLLRSNKKIGIFVISPFVVTVFGALLGWLVWGTGVPEQYRMLSSLIPCYAILIIYSVRQISSKLKLNPWILPSIYIFLFTISIFYIKFNTYFIYPHQDYRYAVELIQKDAKTHSKDWLIKTTDGTSPGAALYDGSLNVEFGPGLIFSTDKSKSELVHLSDAVYKDIEVVYTMYINKDYDLSSLNFTKKNFEYPFLGNLFISKWVK